MCLQSKILLWLVESLPEAGKTFHLIANLTKTKGSRRGTRLVSLPLAEAAKGFPGVCPHEPGCLAADLPKLRARQQSWLLHR